MAGAAIQAVDIQNTFGAAFVGLLLSAVYIFPLCLPIPSLTRSWRIHSLYGVTIVQT